MCGSEGPPAATSVPGDTREGRWSWEHFGDSQDIGLSVLQPWWDRQTWEGGIHRQLRVWDTQQIATITFQLLPACFWKGADFSWPRSFTLSDDQVLMIPVIILARNKCIF